MRFFFFWLPFLFEKRVGGGTALTATHTTHTMWCPQAARHLLTPLSIPAPPPPRLVCSYVLQRHSTPLVMNTCYLWPVNKVRTGQPARGVVRAGGWVRGDMDAVQPRLPGWGASVVLLLVVVRAPGTSPDSTSSQHTTSLLLSLADVVFTSFL